MSSKAFFCLGKAFTDSECCSALFGYDQGVMSGIITAPAFNNIFTATRDNSTMQGTVTAIYEIGARISEVLIHHFPLVLCGASYMHFRPAQGRLG